MKQNFQNKKSLIFILYKVVKSNVFVSIISFASSVIIFRHLENSEYGIYILALVFFSFFDIIVNSFDSILIKNIYACGTIKRYRLLSIILSIKIILIMLSFLLFHFLYKFSIFALNITSSVEQIYSNIYVILALIFIFKHILNTLQTLFTSYMRYDYLFNSQIATALLGLIASIAISALDLDVVNYVFLLLVVFIINTIYSFILLKNMKKVFIRFLIGNKSLYDLKDTYKNIIVPYYMPLLGVGVLSFFKNNLPTYFIGTMISLELLAIYSVLAKQVDFLHKVYANVIISIYPKIFKMIDNNYKVLDKIFYIGLIIRIVLFIVLIYTYNIVIQLYGLKDTNINYFIYILLITIFLVTYFVTFFNLVIMYQNRTLSILKASIFRNILLFVLPNSLFLFYDIKGFFYGLLLAEISMTIYVIFLISKVYNNHKIVERYFIIITIFILVYYANYIRG